MCNIGKIDRILRAVVGLALIAYGSMFDTMILTGIGVVALLTALSAFCPLYPLLKLNTGCKRKEKEV